MVFVYILLALLVLIFVPLLLASLGIAGALKLIIQGGKFDKGESERENEEQAASDDNRRSGNGSGRRSRLSSFFDRISDFINRGGKSKRRKKIPDDVGEYVAFTEIEDDGRRESTSAPEPFEPEEQIEDVEWKDL